MVARAQFYTQKQQCRDVQRCGERAGNVLENKDVLGCQKQG